MSLRQKYRQILSGVIPAGAVGLSVLLGSALSSSAREHPASLQPLASTTVSERLAAIREAVSDASGQDTSTTRPSDGELRLAWGNWWRNWGWGPRRWGWPNWNNWRNWPNWGNWWHNW